MNIHIEKDVPKHHIETVREMCAKDGMEFICMAIRENENFNLYFREEGVEEDEKSNTDK